MRILHLSSDHSHAKSTDFTAGVYVFSENEFVFSTFRTPSKTCNHMHLMINLLNINSLKQNLWEIMLNNWIITV